MAKNKKTWAEVLREMPDQYLGCRDVRHSWDVQGTQWSFEDRDRLVVRRRECSNCPAVQVAVIIRSSGEYLGGKVKVSYPPGYVQSGMGRAVPSDVRKETVRRAYTRIARARKAATAPAEQEVETAREA